MGEPSVQGEPASQKPVHELFGAALRHPMAAILVGFLLTGVVGSSISNHISEQRQQEADAVHLRDTRREALKGFSHSLSERLMRAQMLIVAIEKHSSVQTITELKKLRDETESKAKLEHADFLILAREVLGADHFAAWRAEVDEHLVRKRAHPLQECIEKACETTIAGGDGAAVLKEGKADQLLQECQVALEVLIDGFYDLSMVSNLPPSSSEVTKARKNLMDNLAKACP